MAKSKDKSRISQIGHLGLQQELQTVRQQLRGRWREKLQVDRHSLDVEEATLRLQERKAELEQPVYKQHHLAGKDDGPPFGR